MILEYGHRLRINDIGSMVVEPLNLRIDKLESSGTKKDLAIIGLSTIIGTLFGILIF